MKRISQDMMECCGSAAVSLSRARQDGADWRSLLSSLSDSRWDATHGMSPRSQWICITNRRKLLKEQRTRGLLSNMKKTLYVVLLASQMGCASTHLKNPSAWWWSPGTVTVTGSWGTVSEPIWTPIHHKALQVTRSITFRNWTQHVSIQSHHLVFTFSECQATHMPTFPIPTTDKGGLTPTTRRNVDEWAGEHQVVSQWRLAKLVN